MSEPVVFTQATPRFDLPYLFAAQAQREFFINEAFARIDALLHMTVAGERLDPPDGATAGMAYLVAPGATGAFAGRDGSIAVRDDTAWMFIAPRDGMTVFDMNVGATRRRIGGHWIAPSAPVPPAGGSVIDDQARDAIAGLVAVLKQAGVIS